MRKLYPGYEEFVKEQKPKYGKTFIEWFFENHKVGDVDLLEEISKRNICPVENNDFPEFYTQMHIGYFKDFFTKKLQLCFNLISFMTNENIRYELDVVADIMDLYEEIIQEICIRDNIYVCGLPSGFFHGNTYTTSIHDFKNFNELKQEFETGTIIIFYFKIAENGAIEIRYSKREQAITRSVLFERVNH